MVVKESYPVCLRVIISKLIILFENNIGWRPSSITASCRSFPDDAPPPLLKGNPLHGMDCQDIIVAKVNGDSSNVGDYYTRDR